MATKFLSTKKLEHIENETFKLGNISAKAFEQTENFNSLKATIMAYRCSMQAIRDQARYKINKKIK